MVANLVKMATKQEVNNMKEQIEVMQQQLLQAMFLKDNIASDAARLSQRSERSKNQDKSSQGQNRAKGVWRHTLIY